VTDVREQARALAGRLLPLREEAKRLEIYGDRYLSDDWHRIHPQLEDVHGDLEMFLAIHAVEIVAELARDA
jgi:hypothetical protein